MIISMRMMSHILHDKVAIESIVDGDPVITGIRCMVSSRERTVNDTLYIVPDDVEDKRFHLINRNDWITIYADDIGDALNIVLAVQDKLDNWEKRLSEAANRGDVHKIAMLTEEVTSNPVSIMNTFGVIVSHTEVTPEEKKNPLVEKLFASKMIPVRPMSKPQVLENVAGNQGNGKRHSRVFINDSTSTPYAGVFSFRDDSDIELAGMTVIQLRRPIDESDLQLMDVAGKYLGIALANCPPEMLEGRMALFQGIIEDGHELSDEMLRRMLAPYRPGAEIRMVAMRHCVKNDDFQRRMLTQWLRNRFPTCLTATIDDCVVALMTDSQVSELASANTLAFLKDEMVTAGASLPFTDPHLIMSRTNQAHFALDCGNNEPGLNRCEQYACRKMIEGLRSAPWVKDLIHPALGRLKAYDKKHGSSLYDTLRHYLANERSLTRCAAKMYVHKNTLLYRLKRIRAIIGDIMDDDEERLCLVLSFLIADSDDLDGATQPDRPEGDLPTI